MRSVYLFMMAFVFVLASCISAPSARAGVSKAIIGQKAPDFSIPDAVTNDNVSLQFLLSNSKAVLLVFISTMCPDSTSYNARIQNIANVYGGQGVSVIGIDSNASETDQGVVEYKWEHKLTFQILKDFNNVAADAYGASRTPEAYLIDTNGNLAYHGRIDDNVQASKVTSHDLTNALDALLAGKAILTPETKVFGCTIKRNWQQ